MAHLTPINFHSQSNDKVETQYKAKKVKDRSDGITVSPQQFINRILCTCDCPMKLKECLSYELASRPPSLFDDVSFRRGQKSAMSKIFANGLQKCSTLYGVRGATFVLDGGFLIHFVSWPNNTTYGGVVNEYCNFVTLNYGYNVIVVFDGYPEYSTTKNKEQTRRNIGTNKSSSDIHFEKDTECRIPKEEFLCNTRNKKRLLEALALELNRRDISTLTAGDDADVDVVNVALEKLKHCSKVVVVGTDTDLLTLLVALAPEKKKIYFSKPIGGTKTTFVYNIASLIEQNSDIRKGLLFVHAMTGCDTTSCMFGVGKLKAFSMIKTSKEYWEQASLFLKQNVSKEELLVSGERFTLGLYGMNRYSNLNEARYVKFTTMLRRSKSNFNLARLPPTSEACQQHILRVYLQIQKWLGNSLPATEWGWRLESVNGSDEEKPVLQPVTSLKPSLPDDHLNLVPWS